MCRCSVTCAVPGSGPSPLPAPPPAQPQACPYPPSRRLPPRSAKRLHHDSRRNDCCQRLGTLRPRAPAARAPSRPSGRGCRAPPRPRHEPAPPAAAGEPWRDFGRRNVREIARGNRVPREGHTRSGRSALTSRTTSEKRSGVIHPSAWTSLIQTIRYPSKARPSTANGTSIRSTSTHPGSTPRAYPTPPSPKTPPPARERPASLKNPGQDNLRDVPNLLGLRR